MSFAVVIVVLQGLRPEPAARGPVLILHLSSRDGQCRSATSSSDSDPGLCRQSSFPVTSE